MKIRHPRPKVMMSRTLEACEPEYIDTLPPIVREFWNCEYRVYVTDAMIDSDWTLSLEAAMVAGKTNFDADKAAGRAYIPNEQPPLREQNHPPLVYYMRMSDLVKIGTTGLIRARFDAIHPQGVMAVEWGGRELERQRHNQFVDLHSHGEWFRLEPELVDHVFALRESFRGEDGENIDQWLAPRLPAVDRLAPPSWMLPPRRA